MKFLHPRFDESLNVSSRRPLREFVTYLTAVVLLLGVVFYGSVFLVGLIVPHVSPESERWLWENLLKDTYADDEGRTKLTVKRERYLQSILDRLPKDGLPYPTYQVILLEDPEVNAMALPSGKIVVNAGLLDHIKSENGMAFVLAHELGHFAHRDHLRGMGRTLITGLLLASVFTGDDNVGSWMDGIGKGMDLHFSRSQEKEADEFGLDLLAKAYGHAGGAEELFTYIDAHENSPLLEGYLSTHPLGRDRIAHLNARMVGRGIPRKETKKWRLPMR